MILAKEFEGELWIKAAHHDRAVKHAVETEREACAVICDRGDPMFKPALTQFDCADLIRARGQE
jgi:hypothetical protein